MDKLEKQIEPTPIPEAAQRLLSNDGYFQRFFELVGAHSTYQEAYIALECEYEQYFGQEKYANYDTFRQAKRRYLKNLQLKAKKI